jgi:hypothetical protein
MKGIGNGWSYPASGGARREGSLKDVWKRGAAGGIEKRAAVVIGITGASTSGVSTVFVLYVQKKQNPADVAASLLWCFRLSTVTAWLLPAQRLRELSAESLAFRCEISCVALASEAIR